MFYKFLFVHAGRTGVVSVYPTGAFVTYNGVGAQIEAWRGPILHSIFKARVAALPPSRSAWIVSA